MLTYLLKVIIMRNAHCCREVSVVNVVKYLQNGIAISKFDISVEGGYPLMNGETSTMQVNQINLWL
jgi:hypothetical protein